MSFPRYPRYKPSGVEWLGNVPEHWELKALKRTVRIMPSNVDKKSVAGEKTVRLCNYTDVYYNDVIRDAGEFMEATAPPAKVAKFELRYGDVLITKDSETADDIARSAFVAANLPDVLCGYHLAILRPSDVTDGSYLKWLCDSVWLRASTEVRARGLTRVGLPMDELGAMKIPCPPVREQRVIAKFIVREVARLDGLVEQQQSLLRALREKRQAVISHAVTKGLNPDAPLKPSGIESLGDVPTHWSLTPLMWLTPDDRRIMYGIVLPGPDVDDGVPIVKGGDVAPERLNLAGLKRTTREIESGYARSRLEAGDIVYAIRGSIGAAELVPTEIEGANITQDVARVAPLPGCNGKWLLWALRSQGVFQQLEQGATGATIRGINIFSLKRAIIPVPTIEEREQIVEHLESATSLLDDLSAEAQRAIVLLNERRAALITAAVTGQIDVPGLVPQEAVS